MKKIFSGITGKGILCALIIILLTLGIEVKKIKAKTKGEIIGIMVINSSDDLKVQVGIAGKYRYRIWEMSDKTINSDVEDVVYKKDDLLEQIGIKNIKSIELQSTQHGAKITYRVKDKIYYSVLETRFGLLFMFADREKTKKEDK